MDPKNEFEKDAQVSTTPKVDGTLSPDTKRELTDEEIASVAGGTKYGAGAGGTFHQQPVFNKPTTNSP